MIQLDVHQWNLIAVAIALAFVAKKTIKCGLKNPRSGILTLVVFAAVLHDTWPNWWLAIWALVPLAFYAFGYEEYEHQPL